MERQVSVDQVCTGRPIRLKLFGNGDAALATCVASRIVTERVWRVTLVSYSIKCLLVCFHEVKLGAPKSANVVCIAVGEIVIGMI